MFVGTITGLRHTKRRGREMLIVVAMDPLCKAAASRRTLAYEQMSDSEIVSQVIQQAQLTPGTVDEVPGKNPYVLQRNESDLEFLKRLAARNNYLLMSDEGKINFIKPQFEGDGVEIKDAVVETLDYSMNAFQIPPSITAFGWDYVATAMVEGTASPQDVVSIGGGENAVAAAAKIWSDTSYVSDVQVSTQGGAKAIAVSELNRAARNFLRGTARVEGDATIHAGAKVKFVGYPTGFNPEVYVISARHRFEPKRGYVTEIQFCGNTMPE
jgi:phage protein D